MEKVSYQDKLDFSKAKKPEIISQIEMRPLSKEKIKKAKEAIRKLKESWMGQQEDTNAVEPIYDKLYYQALEIMEEEDLVEISGVAEIKLD
ncbi:MAG: hypothetical protein C4567_07675 [Deltaproteobacteria bacterium]|nr:MAG: hypothetical protein C4567_07675 [Deltaproteobacteria bacterium]